MKSWKKAISLALSAVTALCFCACGDGGTMGPTEVASGYARYDLEEALSATTVGMGAQIDTDVYMPWNNLTPEEEAMLEQRIIDMNLQYTRIKFFPEFFERANDNSDPNTFDYTAAGVDFESVEMQALYKILDICEEQHINVDLSWYGCHAWFDSYDGQYDGTWMGYTKEELPNAWVTAPRVGNYEEYAENISVMLDYLINTKGYTCIYGFSVIAEMFINAEGVISFAAYADCCRIVDERLKTDGLRDKVRFIGTSNSANVVRYYEEEQLAVKDYFDVGGIGNYNWENSDNLESAYNYFFDIMEVADKYNWEGMIISEFCQGKHFINAVDKTDIDDYEAGLYIARFMIAATNNGVTGFDHYILGDTWFTNAYVHTMGLWQYRNADWKAHPEYYFWGLICKYTDIGSKIYPIQMVNDEIMMVAFELPDGSWSYMIANNATQTKRVAIVNNNVNKPKSLNAYKITESLIPEDRACVLPEAYTTVNSSGGIAHVSLPAKSFTVLSSKAA